MTRWHEFVVNCLIQNPIVLVLGYEMHRGQTPYYWFRSQLHSLKFTNTIKVPLLKITTREQSSEQRS